MPPSLPLSLHLPPCVTSAAGKRDAEGGGGGGVSGGGGVQLRAHCNVLALPAVAEEECAVNANDRRWTKSG